MTVNDKTCADRLSALSFSHDVWCPRFVPKVRDVAQAAGDQNVHYPFNKHHPDALYT